MARLEANESISFHHPQWHCVVTDDTLPLLDESNSNHAAIPLPSATTGSKTPFNCAHPRAHTQTHPKQLEATVTVWEPKNVPATASHTNCPWLPAAATLAGKKHNVSRSGFLPTASSMQTVMQCYAASPDKRACMLRLPLHNKPHATGMQPFCSITWQAFMYLRTWQ